MKGRVLLASDGSVHRINAQVDATNTLTFTPAVSNANLVEAGDTAEVFNKRGKGFTPTEYRDAINAAINDAFPLGLIEVTDASAAFDATSPEVTVDVQLVYVKTVEWEDDDDFRTVIPLATQTNQYGWIADGASGKIRILGYPASIANGYDLLLTGYGRQDILTSDSDTCLLNAEYIVSRACEHLALSAIDRDPMFGQMFGQFQREAERYRSRVRTLNKGELVRSR
jgi:hypothetical protein